MKTNHLLRPIILVFAIAMAGFGQSAGTAERLKDVRKIFVDETSFRIVSSSCGTRAGGMVLPCQKHSTERLEFLVVLKRWLGKTGFELVDSEEKADGILQGTMAMNDYAHQPSINDRIRGKRKDPDPIDMAQWDVVAWITNVDGRRIWTIRQEPYPEFTYGFSSKAKIEGKKLAKAIEYDRKKNR